VRPMARSVVLWLAITSHPVSIPDISFLLVIHEWQGGSISVSFNYLQKTSWYLYIFSSCIYPSITNKTASQESHGANLRSHSIKMIKTTTKCKICSNSHCWDHEFLHVSTPLGHHQCSVYN
jgi:hypothetical protein